MASRGRNSAHAGGRRACPPRPASRHHADLAPPAAVGGSSQTRQRWGDGAVADGMASRAATDDTRARETAGGKMRGQAGLCHHPLCTLMGTNGGDEKGTSAYSSASRTSLQSGH